MDSFSDYVSKRLNEKNAKIWQDALKQGNQFQRHVLMSCYLTKDLTSGQKSNAVIQVFHYGISYYPKWQFDDNAENGVLSGLQIAKSLLYMYSDWEFISFMLSRNAGLDDQISPLDALKLGQILEVHNVCSNHEGTW